MNENLNLCKILKDCPKGTKLWSPVWGDVVLKEIAGKVFPAIILTASDFNDISLHSNGKMYDIEESECILFPSKNQRDWSKFKVPVKKFEVPAKKFNPEEFKPFDKILVRDDDIFLWYPAIFGVLEQVDSRRVINDIGGNYWIQGIPYNNDTECLVQTSNNCPDYYKWWEK